LIRRYSGSGIYRHVKLTVAPLVHVAEHGFGIMTPEVSAASATIASQVENETKKNRLLHSLSSWLPFFLRFFKVTVKNDGASAAAATVTVAYFAPSGALLGHVQTTVTVPAGSNTTAALPLFQTTSPQLWSPDTPFV
jgi:beta-galactosidase